MQNTAISKHRTKWDCFSYRYKLYKWFEQCRNAIERCARDGSQRGTVVPAALPPIWREHFFWRQYIIREKWNYTAYNWNMVTKHTSCKANSALSETVISETLLSIIRTKRVSMVNFSYIICIPSCCREKKSGKDSLRRRIIVTPVWKWEVINGMVSKLASTIQIVLW